MTCIIMCVKQKKKEVNEIKLMSMWHCKRKKLGHVLNMMLLCAMKLLYIKNCFTSRLFVVIYMYLYSAVSVCIFWSSHLLCVAFIFHLYESLCIWTWQCKWDNRLMWWRTCDVNFGVIFVVTHQIQGFFIIITGYVCE